MQQPSLIILAAGMGSRYGGLKQMDPVDEFGHFLIDYSIYDALRAGFSRVICIIKKEIERDFQEMFAHRVQAHVRLDLAFQELDMLPIGCVMPPERTKPWGTGHALLCARDHVDGPFAVINADDYYGPRAFELLHGYLSVPHKSGDFCMVGFPLENTLSDSGEVTRGICHQDSSGALTHIIETKGVRRAAGGGAYEKDGKEYFLPAGTIASMNCWGFDKSLFDGLYAGFSAFWQQGMQNNPLSCEYLLPSVVHDLIVAKTASVSMLQSQDTWFGMTYQQDRPLVWDAIARLKAAGVYPEKLW